MSKFVWLNGELVAAADARISVHDAGFTHAAGLFETMRAMNGRVLYLGEHLERMQASANALGMGVQIDANAIAAGIDALLQANELTDSRLRLVATPGHIPRPGSDDPGELTPTCLITAGPLAAYPPELYQNGMRVCICPYRQNAKDPLAGHKTLAYLPRLLAMKAAAERRCNEALWFNTDLRLAEGSVCNVFIIEGESLITPPLDTPVLPGVTRAKIIEIAKANDVVVSEEEIIIERLLAATEVFLTGSVLQVMPVTAIEKHMVGKGTPGELTKRMADWYQAEIERESAGHGEAD